MRFALTGVLIALASYAVASLLASLASALAYLALRARGRSASSATLLGLRLLPTALPLLVVVTLVVPSFILLEPSAAEEPGAALLALAAAGAALLASGVLAAARALRATRALAEEWTRRGQVVDLPGAPAPARLVAQSGALLSVVGIRRPQLFVGSEVMAALEDEELKAALAHEAAHLHAHDNLKRLLGRAAPDWLRATRLGVQLGEAWQEACEEEADARAVGGERADALALASALVKIGRLAPQASALPVSSFHRGGPLARRVRGLAADPRPRPTSSASTLAAAFGLLAVALVVLAAQPRARVQVHAWSESLVNLPVLR